MADALGFATSSRASRAVSVTNGTQKDINAFQKNAGPLASVVGQGPDASYQKFVQQQQQKQQAAKAMQQQVQQKAAPQHQTLLNRLQGAVANIGKAGVAVAKPVTDVIGGTASAVNNEIHNKPVTTAPLGKAVHDTAQLSSDATGGLLNQFTKGVAQAPGAVAGEIASQSKNPYVRAQGVQAVQGAQKKAFGTTDSGTIAKKIAASTVGTGTLFAGGGELAGAKTLLSAGAKVASKQVAKDAAIGATGNAASTVTQNPNASAKDIGKSAAIGGLLGAVAPHAIKGAGDVGRSVATKVDNSESKFLQPAKDVVNTVQGNAAQGQNDLFNAKTNALLSKAQNLETTGHVAITPHVAYEPTNPRVKTLIDATQKQQQAVEAPMKAAQAEQSKTANEAEKAQADGQKIDRQIELIQAKGKDSETGLSNVDKTKLSHLQEDKAQVGATPQPGEVIKPTAPVEPVAKPVSESPNVAAPAKAETAQPVAPKENVAQPNNSAKVDTTPIKQQIETIKKADTSYDKNGNITPEAGKQITVLNKQLNAAGERVPKAEKPVTVTPINETPPATPDIKVTKLSQGVEANSIKHGITEAFADKPEYAKVNRAQQVKAATALLKQDPQRVINIAMGHEKPPEGLLPESAYIAAEQHAIKSKDAALLTKLGTQSHLVSEATGMGQRISMLAEREGTSPTRAIKQVQDARIAAAEKRIGKPVAKAVSDEVKAIRAAKPTVTKETWGSFIESIKC